MLCTGCAPKATPQPTVETADQRYERLIQEERDGIAATRSPDEAPDGVDSRATIAPGMPRVTNTLARG